MDLDLRFCRPMHDRAANFVPIPTAGPPAAQSANSSVNSSALDVWEAAITAIYCKKNPKKLEQQDYVRKLLLSAKGREQEMYRMICPRYGLDGNKLYLRPEDFPEDPDVLPEEAPSTPPQREPAALEGPRRTVAPHQTKQCLHQRGRGAPGDHRLEDTSTMGSWRRRSTARAFSR